MPVTQIAFKVPLKERYSIVPSCTIACVAGVYFQKRAKGTKLRASAKSKEQGKGMGKKKKLSPYFCLPQARSFARPLSCSLVRFVLLKKVKKRLLCRPLARLFTFHATLGLICTRIL